MNKLAAEKGPKLYDVLQLVAFLIRGKKLMGYHLPMKLADIGMTALLQREL